MLRKVLMCLLLGAAWLGVAGSAEAQQNQSSNTPLPKFYYYPYYYFPHNYWPANSPQWPEPPGAPYQRPPAYQAMPPFREPGWRYEYFEHQRYHRGHHFWLDVF